MDEEQNKMRLSSHRGRGESLQVIGDVVFVGGHVGPLEIIHVYLLARAVVHPAKHVNVVIEVSGRVEESGERHRSKFDELQSL